MLSEAQLRERKMGLGSSDIAAVCGRSPFGSPLTVYQDKLGLREREPNRATEAGNYLEDAVASWAATRQRWSLQKCKRTLRHRRHRWMLATPDRFVVQSRRRAALAEIKTAESPEWIDPERFGRFGDDGSDEVPDCYRCQAQQQMSVTGLDVCYLPTFFFRTRELRIYVLEHNRELEDALVESGERFWNDHVLAKVPPDLDFSDEETGRYLGRVFRERRGIADAPVEAESWAQQLARANEAIDAATDKKKQAENYLKYYVGENRGMVGPWGKFLWYTVESAGTDWEAVARELAGGIGMEDRALDMIRAKHKKPGGRRVSFTPRRAE